MLVSSGWMKLAVDNFKPKDFFLFVKRHNEEVSERCLIYTGTELGLSLWCHQDWKRVGVTFLLWLHVMFISLPNRFVGHLLIPFHALRKAGWIQINSFHIAKVPISWKSPKAPTGCQVLCVEMSKRWSLLGACSAQGRHGCSLRFLGWVMGLGSPSLCWEAHVSWKGERCQAIRALRLGGKALTSPGRGAMWVQAVFPKVWHPPWS